jgi:hypothetical protein
MKSGVSDGLWEETFFILPQLRWLSSHLHARECFVTFILGKQLLS